MTGKQRVYMNASLGVLLHQVMYCTTVLPNTVSETELGKLSIAQSAAPCHRLETVGWTNFKLGCFQ